MSTITAFLCQYVSDTMLLVGIALFGLTALALFVLRTRHHSTALSTAAILSMVIAVALLGTLLFMRLESPCVQPNTTADLKGTLAPGWYAGYFDQQANKISFTARFDTKELCTASVDQLLKENDSAHIILECFYTEDPSLQTTTPPIPEGVMNLPNSATTPTNTFTPTEVTPTTTNATPQRDPRTSDLARNLIFGIKTGGTYVPSTQTSASPDNTNIQQQFKDFFDKIKESLGDTAFSSIPQQTTPPEGSDGAYLQACIANPSKAGCENADVNGDGTINSSDYTDFAIELAQYDINGDAVINLTPGFRQITSCFLKTSVGQCATVEYGDITFDQTYISSMSQTLASALVSGSEMAIDVSKLAALISTSTPLGDITYASIAQYDLNHDGIADFSTKDNLDSAVITQCSGDSPGPDCGKADINRDGSIGTHDLSLLNLMRAGVSLSSFTVNEFEAFAFDVKLYGERSVLDHCIALGSASGSCLYVDFNNDKKVNSEDLSLFKKSAHLDLNGDGLVNGLTGLPAAFSL